MRVHCSEDVDVVVGGVGGGGILSKATSIRSGVASLWPLSLSGFGVGPGQLNLSLDAAAVWVT